MTGASERGIAAAKAARAAPSANVAASGHAASQASQDTSTSTETGSRSSGQRLAPNPSVMARPGPAIHKKPLVDPRAKPGDDGLKAPDPKGPISEQASVRFLLRFRGTVARLVGADDAGDQRVPHHILLGEADDRQTVDRAHRLQCVVETGTAAGRQVDLGR